MHDTVKSDAQVPHSSGSWIQRLLQPNLDDVWIWLTLMLIALRPLLSVLPPHDFWWHMATGRYIVQHGEIPTVDSFSFTQFGQAFYVQSWLAEVLMYALYQLGGVEIIVIVQSLVMTLAYGLLLRLCVIRSGMLRLSVVLLLLTTLPLSFTNWVVRPQSYTFPIFVIFLTVLTEFRLGRANRLWILPLLMVLWVNLHGAFILGLALFGIVFVGEFLKRWFLRDAAIPADARFDPKLSLYILWGGLSTLAIFLNPRGIGIISYVANLLGNNSVTNLVIEWAPPTIRDAGGSGMIFFVFVIICVGLLVYAKKRPDLTDMLLLGAFFWLALGATRNIVWFGFVATPLMVVQAATFFKPISAKTKKVGSVALNWAVIGCLGIVLIGASPWIKPHLGLPEDVGNLLSTDTPIAAVEAIKQDPNRPERLFHTEGFGSYLIWAAPEQPVFIDTRIELYPFEQWSDFITLSQGKDLDALEKYDIDGFLLDKERQAGLIEQLASSASWTTYYEDEYSIYLRR